MTGNCVELLATSFELRINDVDQILLGIIEELNVSLQTFRLCMTQAFSTNDTGAFALHRSDALLRLNP